MNPLARSRLEGAKSRLGMMHLNWQHADIDNETILAALDALLNPQVTDDMIKAMKQAYNYDGLCNDDAQDNDMPACYKAMIAELTKEDV